MFIKKETKEIVKFILNNYKDFTLSDHTFSNDKTRFSLWTANGVLSIDTYPNSNAFNLVEKFYVYKAIKKAVKLKAIYKLKNSIILED